MNEIYDFLKKCETYYLATMDGTQPRVRPFGTIDIYDGRLHVLTGKSKRVSMQIHKNPQIELCGIVAGKWIRIEALAVENDQLEARQHMLDAYPELQQMYQADDGECTVFTLNEVTATISSFTDEPIVIKFW